LVKFVDESAVAYFYGSPFMLKNTSRRTRLLQHLRVTQEVLNLCVVRQNVNGRYWPLDDAER